MSNTENIQPMRKMRANRKNNKKRKVAIIAILSILVLLSTAAVFATSYMDNILGKLDIVSTPKDDDSWGISTKAPTTKDDESKGSTPNNQAVVSSLSGYHNIAVLGVDSYESSGDKFSGHRTDTILIISINKKNGQVKMLSVMRDSYLQVKTADGDYVFTKLNNAHVYGGPMNTCFALNQNLDLNINEFVVFNWKSVADMVDAVGGVDLDVSADELYDMNLGGAASAAALGGKYTPIIKTGVQHLDGVQAVAYCRMRKNSGGETARTDRSRETMMAVYKEARNFSISKLNKITNDALPGIRTNISKTNMFKYMLNIRSYSIAGSSRFPSQYRGGLIGDTWFAVPRNLESNVKVIHKFLFGQSNYVLSDTAKKIGDEIIQRTGYDI